MKTKISSLNRFQSVVLRKLLSGKRGRKIFGLKFGSILLMGDCSKASKFLANAQKFTMTLSLAEFHGPKIYQE
jgi:hypothetical protein